jgi:glycosyltransferase involved in cell wall biosynthesis
VFLYIESIGLRLQNFGSTMDLKRMAKRLYRGLLGIRTEHKNVYVLSPLVIPFFRGSSFIKLFNETVLRLVIERFLRQKKLNRKNSIVWSYHPYAINFLPQSYKNSTVIYHCVDDIASVPGVNSIEFNKQELVFLKRVNTVFVTSKELLKKCSRENCNTFYFPNVVDLEHFLQAHNQCLAPKDISEIPEPRIGYIGVLSDFKVDFDLLYNIAIIKKSWQIILIGEEREGQSDQNLKKLSKLRNVHLLGHKSYAELPSYLSYIDVGLLPSKINSYTKSMFPMKYFEYIASGVPVVSTPLDFLGKEINRRGIQIAHDLPSFIEGVEKQLCDGRLDRSASVMEVGDNTWDGRLNKMLEKISLIR